MDCFIRCCKTLCSTLVDRTYKSWQDLRRLRQVVASLGSKNRYTAVEAYQKVEIWAHNKVNSQRLPLMVCDVCTRSIEEISTKQLYRYRD